MKTIIVGGDIESGKPSSIINKIASNIQDAVCFNGNLPSSVSGYPVVIWTPDISNEHEKDYPVKDQGAVLICTKVIRDDRTEADAVSRIFAMHGNAVIAIYKDDPRQVRFRLIDALGNTWVNTTYIPELCETIGKFLEWTNGQERVSYSKSPDIGYVVDGLPQQLIDINTKLADKVENSLGSRYFGNFSTRCMKLFPSQRISNDSYLFSPRNTDKRRITTSDFVLVEPPHYYGDRKYSVDSPSQIAIYQQFPDINYMIHGHAFIDAATALVPVGETQHYFPCGDMREVEDVASVFETGIRIINLKNHGFLICTEDLDTMDSLVDILPIRQKELLS